jgi:hypothetical protein
VTGVGNIGDGTRVFTFRREGGSPNNRSKSFESAGDLQLARPPRSVSVMPGWDTILTNAFAPPDDQSMCRRSLNHTTVRRS